MLENASPVKRLSAPRPFVMVVMISALGLAGCVGILRHDPVPPTKVGADAAMEAARQSKYIRDREQLRVDTQSAIAQMPGGIVGPLTPARPTEVAWGLQGCLASGEGFSLTDVEIREDGVCGKSGEVARCIPYSEMSAIASPRDATVIGYYPIMERLDCNSR